jgi:hypothetical protein
MPLGFGDVVAVGGTQASIFSGQPLNVIHADSTVSRFEMEKLPYSGQFSGLYRLSLSYRCGQRVPLAEGDEGQLFQTLAKLLADLKMASFRNCGHQRPVSQNYGPPNSGSPQFQASRKFSAGQKLAVLSLVFLSAMAGYVLSPTTIISPDAMAPRGLAGLSMNGNPKMGGPEMGMLEMGTPETGGLKTGPLLAGGPDINGLQAMMQKIMDMHAHPASEPHPASLLSPDLYAGTQHAGGLEAGRPEAGHLETRKSLAGDTQKVEDQGAGVQKAEGQKGESQKGESQKGDAEAKLQALKKINAELAAGKKVDDALLRYLPDDVAARIRALQETKSEDLFVPRNIVNQSRASDPYGIPNVPERASWTALTKPSIPMPGGGDIKSPSDMESFGFQP